MTPEQLKNSANRLAFISDAEIKSLADQLGPGTKTENANLAQTLIDRKTSILKQAAEESKKPPPSEVQAAKARTSSQAHALRKQIAGWSPPNKPSSAIGSYKGSGYVPMNNMMRFGTLLPDDHGAPAENIRAMTDWLDKASSKEDTVLFRGVQSDYAQKLHTFAKPGQILPDDGFMSLATYKGFSDNWHHGTGLTFTVRVPKGSKIGTVAGADSEDGEYEVLTQRKSKLRVLSWDKSHSPSGHYEVELVPPD